MLTTFLETLRSYLGQGYLLAVFFPTLIFWSANLAVGAEVFLSWQRTWLRWTSFALDEQLTLLLAGLIGVAFFAFVVHNLQLSITRFFEGYWSFLPFRWLYKPRRRYYQQEWYYLRAEVQRLDQQLYQEQTISEVCQADNQAGVTQAMLDKALNQWTTLFIPTSEGYRRVQPTRLGNVLRASELYAHAHYGMNAPILWVRLHPLLPSAVVEILQNRKIALDFMLLMSAYAGVFTLIWCPIVAWFTNDWRLFLLCAAGLPVAWICYNSAVQAALAYAEQIRSVFDLYRHQLLGQLGLKQPSTLELERPLWQELSRFFERNIPPAMPYEPAINPAEEWKYSVIIKPTVNEPKGWARMRQAVGQLWQGLQEVLHTNVDQNTP